MEQINKTKFDEDKSRLVMYKDIKNRLVESTDNIKEHNISVQKENITEQSDILKTLDLYIRDQIKITMIDQDGYKYYDNLLLKIKDDKILISNPFVTYANKTFPDDIECSHEEEGVEYRFTLSKINKNDNSQSVSCYLPTNILELRRRGNSRYSPTSNVAIGLYIDNKKTEIIGYMSDISKVGVGISFQDASFNSEILSYLSENKEDKYSIILDNNGSYMPLTVIVKHMFHSRKDKSINLGAEFVDIEKNENFIEFFNKIKYEHNNNKRKIKTKHLILSSKMGIEL